MTSRRRSPFLTSYLTRRTAMFLVLAQELAHGLVRQRHAEAASAARVARIVSARRWQRRHEKAGIRARAARAAVR
jgi:hypothetical protein